MLSWVHNFFLGLKPKYIAQETPALDNTTWNLSLEPWGSWWESGSLKVSSHTYLKPWHPVSRKSCRWGRWCGGSRGSESGLECAWVVCPHRPPRQPRGKGGGSQAPGRGRHTGPACEGGRHPILPSPAPQGTAASIQMLLGKGGDVFLTVPDLTESHTAFIPEIPFGAPLPRLQVLKIKTRRTHYYTENRRPTRAYYNSTGKCTNFWNNLQGKITWIRIHRYIWITLLCTRN